MQEPHGSIGSPPPSLIPKGQWDDFMEWARDGGYDESYFNRWDSKSRELEKRYLEEMEEQAQEARIPLEKPKARSTTPSI